MKIIALLIVFNLLMLDTIRAAETKPAIDNSVRGTGPANDPTRQTDADWMDDRYAKTMFGSFVSGHIATPKGSTHKGIAVQVGWKGEGTLVFDTDLCVWRAGWTGGFLKPHPRRYGLINPLTPEGTMVFSSPASPGVANEVGSFADPRNPKNGPLPRGHVRYKGIYLADDRAVLRYDVGKTEIYDAPWIRAGADGSLQFERVVMVKSVNGKCFTMKLTDVTAKINLRELQVASGTENQGITLEPGRLRWGAPIVTQGVVDRRKTPFAIDTITVPYKNPYQALMFTAGHDFTVNGDCYVAMAHGDVWKVTGIDAELKAVKWQRFATGLYQPLGLRVIKDQVYVLSLIHI